MYKLILGFILIFAFEKSNAQELHHQMIGAQGGSYSINNSIIVEQSIGQIVVHGLDADEKIALQGFQQNIWYKLKGSNPKQIAIQIYPNPFVENIHFRFSQPLNSAVNITLFDLLGRKIFNTEILPENQEISLKLDFLPTAEYIVLLKNTEIQQSFKILKK